MTSYDDYKYCPNCGWTGHFIEKPYANFDWIKYPELPNGNLIDWFPQFPWGHVNVPHINVLGIDFDIWYDLTCKKCRWSGKGNELISDGDIKNRKRTELIDRMLYDK